MYLHPYIHTHVVTFICICNSVVTVSTTKNAMCVFESVNYLNI